MDQTLSRVVYLGKDRGLSFIHEEISVKLPALEDDEILIKVLYAGICEKELTSIENGSAYLKPPCVLGHECVGEVLESRRAQIDQADTVVFSQSATCNKCHQCRNDNHHKCQSRVQYGVACIQGGTHRYQGAFSSHVILVAGTGVARLPATLSPQLAVTSNCVLSTAMAAAHSVTNSNNQPVLVQGAGITGLYVCSVLHQSGNKRVYCSDPDVHRALKAQPFGATIVHHELPRYGTTATPPSFPVVIDTLCSDDSVRHSLENISEHGVYVMVRSPHTQSNTNIAIHDILAKALTIKAVSDGENYLERAVEFLAQCHNGYPFSALFHPDVINLKEFHKALELAKSSGYCRVLVQP